MGISSWLKGLFSSKANSIDASNDEVLLQATDESQCSTDADSELESYRVALAGLNVTMPESPFEQDLQQGIDSIITQYGPMAYDAIYLAVTKRMVKRSYQPESRDYLQALLNDVDDAKREHYEVCYSSNVASNVFMALKVLIVELKASTN